MSGITFSATPYDSAVVLNWFAGAGSPGSTPDQLCEITIQFASVDTSVREFGHLKAELLESAKYIIPNTPPYVVRELQQFQMTNGRFYHAGLVNENIYRYSIFVHYMDTGEWEGPILLPATIPHAGLSSPLVSGSLSYSKLGINTKLSKGNENVVELVVWLPDNQVDRRPELVSVINQLKPAHVRADIIYEPYYVAHTTETHFTSGSYDTDTYEIVDSTLKNKVPTIDYSFSGVREILGGT